MQKLCICSYFLKINFTNDNNRDSNSLDYLPKYNPVINQEAAEYVDSILKSNEFDKLFKLVGVEMPKDIKGDEMDPLFDEVREKAIELGQTLVDGAFGLYQAAGELY